MVNYLYLLSKDLFEDEGDGTKSLRSGVELPPGTRIKGKSEFAYKVTGEDTDQRIAILKTNGCISVNAFACVVDQSDVLDEDWRVTYNDVYNIYDNSDYHHRRATYSHTIYGRNILEYDRFNVELNADDRFVIVLPKMVKLVFDECESVTISGRGYPDITFEE